MGDLIQSDKTMGASGKEAVGSVGQLVDLKGYPTVYKKIAADAWVPQDLTDQEVSDILKDMTTETNTPKKKREATLIPSADVYLDNGFNVLLVGLHGTGKTESIKQIADARGIKMKYYSCSTLDPYTDLVGVPTPRDYCPECQDYFKDAPTCPTCNGKTVESLKMVRPRDVDEAELIFFDEFNRADAKMQNAVFEIIQFGTINGEPLPNLKACWAAINPPDDAQNYAVEAIDPALLDRFDIYVDITPKPSVVYMSKHMPTPIAAALKAWWDEHMNAIKQKSKNKDPFASMEPSEYISPRRLEKIGLVWCATKSRLSVKACLPMGGDFAEGKLVDLLKAAQREVDRGLNPDAVDDYDDEDDEESDMSGNNLGDRPWDQVVYRPADLKLNASKVAEYLTKNPMHEATHKAVTDALKQGIGGPVLVKDYGEILDALTPSTLEAMIAAFPQAKIKMMQDGFMGMHTDNPAHAKSLKNLYKVLSKALTPGAGWPKL